MNGTNDWHIRLWIACWSKHGMGPDKFGTPTKNWKAIVALTASAHSGGVSNQECGIVDTHRSSGSM